MIGEAPISFWEFAMKEPLPLSVVHDACGGGGGGPAQERNREHPGA